MGLAALRKQTAKSFAITTQLQAYMTLHHVKALPASQKSTSAVITPSLLASGLKDCCLIVAQLLYALLDVRHGCVKSLHMTQPILSNGPQQMLLAIYSVALP